MKPLWKSKTFWASILSFAASLLAIFEVDLPTEVQEQIVVGIMAVIGLIGTICGRMAARGPASLTGK